MRSSEAATLADMPAESPAALQTLHLYARGRVLNGPRAAETFRDHRRMRKLRFFILEIIAVTITVLSVVAGISTRYLDDALTPVFRVLPISAATAAVVLPILYFGNPKFRKRRGRRSRR
jgi:hypothetical protein